MQPRKLWDCLSKPRRVCALILSFAILISMQPFTVGAASGQARLRIERPASSGRKADLDSRLPGQCGIDASCSEMNAAETCGSGFLLQQNSALFKSILPGIAQRWWRKLRNPSVCPFVLCGSSCADISGKPRIGAYDLMQLFSDITPCSLQDFGPASGSCCMGSTLEQSARVSEPCCSPNGDGEE